MCGSGDSFRADGRLARVRCKRSPRALLVFTGNRSSRDRGCLVTGHSPVSCERNAPHAADQPTCCACPPCRRKPRRAERSLTRSARSERAGEPASSWRARHSVLTARAFSIRRRSNSSPDALETTGSSGGEPETGAARARDVRARRQRVCRAPGGRPGVCPKAAHKQAHATAARETGARTGAEHRGVRPACSHASTPRTRTRAGSGRSAAAPKMPRGPEGGWGRGPPRRPTRCARPRASAQALAAAQRTALIPRKLPRVHLRRAGLRASA